MSHAQQKLTELLNKIAAERALSNPRVNIQPISSGGANYTSDLFLATIADGHTELQLFAKVAAVGEKFRKEMPIRLFATENVFYTKLANIYKELQDMHNVPEDKRFISPEFYGCSDELYEEIIVIENFTAKGFTVYDRLKSVDWEYASKAVEQIARFHALSIAFEKQNKEEYDKILEELTSTSDHKTNQYFKGIFLKSLDVVEDEYRDRTKAFLETFGALDFAEMCKPLRRSVLAHLDCRVSNQMYRRDADGHVQIRLVDYQTIRAAPPVLDLMYFIFTSTDEKFRAQYYEKLLDHYYTELCLAMKRLDLNSEEIYSREDFDFEYKAKLGFGLYLAAFTLPMITVDAENVPKIHMDIDMVVQNTSGLFPERLNGIVHDFVRWGLI